MQVFNPTQISLGKLLSEAMANRGKIKHIYLHWTAGRYDQFFDDYHLNIDGDGKVYRTCASLDERKAHTYQRNSGSIGITLCCALDASWQGEKPDLGSYPPTTMQLVAQDAVIAIEPPVQENPEPETDTPADPAISVEARNASVPH